MCSFEGNSDSEMQASWHFFFILKAKLGSKVDDVPVDERMYQHLINKYLFLGR